MKETPRPECERLVKVAPYSQKIGEFLDWLDERGITLARPHDHTEECYDSEGYRACGVRSGDLDYYYCSKEKLFAEFFEIDLNKVEEERRNLMEELRRK
jgi:hypothetical protein